MSRAPRIGLLLASTAAAAVLTVPPPARAAVITIVNANQPGVGFNDPTPATPVGGNNGTTVGQQALNVFQHAADIWGALLDDDVEIKIRASFEPLDCTATSGTLGAAGPLAAVHDFPNAPLAGTWYPSALANRIAGTALRGAAEDIQARFNSKLGTTGCLEGTGWYYGFDGDHGSKFDLVAVLLHEFAHGLGFLTFVDDGDWSEFEGLPDVFETHILDVQAGKHWDQMSDSERLASATRTGKLDWDGIDVQANTRSTLDPLPVLQVGSPAAIANDYAVGTASFGGDVTTAGISGNLVQATDASDVAGTLTTDGCSTITNASAVSGKVALIDRGTCPFTDKATHAQAAGAIAVVIANNQSGIIQMGGNAPGVSIPVVSISQADATAIRAQLSQGVSVKIFANPRHLAGTGLEDRMLLYAPNPVEQGSSISHWDTSAVPNLLMEPNLSSDLPHTVDLTLPALRDIGWFSDTGPAAGPRGATSRVQQEDQPKVVPRP